MPNTFIKLPEPEYKEQSAFTATVYFRDSSDAADTPTTVHYRIDDITTRTKIADWTSVTPGVSVSISVSPTNNKIVAEGNRWERRQLTVSSDKGLTTETRDTVDWKVRNIRGFIG